MSHGIQAGVDHMAATETRTIWHAGETVENGTLVEVPVIFNADGSPDYESTVLAMGAAVFPDGSDNDVSGTEPIAIVEKNDNGQWIVRGEPIETHVATVSPSGRYLGTVTSGYQPVSGRFLFAEWVLNLARAGGKPESLGTFDGGRSFFHCCQVADEWHVPGDHSPMRTLFNLLAGHDGTRGILGAFDNFRVICKNTGKAFERSHASDEGNARARVERAWQSIKHTVSAKDRVRDAVAWITDGRARALSEQQMLAQLASKVVSRSEVDAFVDRYISIPKDATKRTQSIRENQRESFLQVLQDVNDLGNHALGGSGISAYGLLQGVTRFEDHIAPVKAKDQPVGVRRAFRSFLGERDIEKETARDMIEEMVMVRPR